MAYARGKFIGITGGTGEMQMVLCRHGFEGHLCGPHQMTSPNYNDEPNNDNELLAHHNYDDNYNNDNQHQ